MKPNLSPHRPLLPPSVSDLQKKNEESENKRKKEVNLVISHAPSADNSNLSADGDDSFISVEMDSAMPSPFSEVRESRGKTVKGVSVRLSK